MTYVRYFDQVLVKGFLPLSKSLTLSKIVLVNELEEFNHVTKPVEDEDSEP